MRTPCASLNKAGRMEGRSARHAGTAGWTDGVAGEREREREREPCIDGGRGGWRGEGGERGASGVK
jgi:hypothetical protein